MRVPATDRRLMREAARTAEASEHRLEVAAARLGRRWQRDIAAETFTG